MKVLFIYYDTASSALPGVGFGVAYLSGFLKRHGHETTLCYFRASEDIDYVLSSIVEWSPHIIAHSSTSSSFFSVKEVVQKIRVNHPNLFQICGGNHVSLCPDELLKLPELDAICIGYGEFPLLELVQAIEAGRDYNNIHNLYFRLNEEIVENPLREFPSNLDPFIPCDRQIFYDEFERRSIEDRSCCNPGGNVQEFIFCRGCPFDCTFCSNHVLKTLGSGKYIQFPSVKKCIEELVQVRSDLKMTRVAFHDDNFTLNKSWFREFTAEYKKRVALPYGCNLRVNCFNEEDVKCLKDSGCVSATLGLESGNEYIRNVVMQKGIGQEDIVTAFELLHKHGIKTCSQNMLGLPEETPERFLETIRINAKIVPNAPAISVFFPYPGTVLYDRCVKENLWGGNSETQEGFKEREDTNLELPSFPRKDILFYFYNFHRLVRYEYLSNKHKTIKKIFPLNLKNQKKIAFFMKIINFPCKQTIKNYFFSVCRN